MNNGHINSVVKLLFPALALLVSPQLHAKYYMLDRGVTFENVSEKIDFKREVDVEGFAGVAWLDYDNDNDLDLLLTNTVGASTGLFKNDNGNFIDVTEESGLFSLSGNSGVVVGDIDNDGYPDVFMSGMGHFFGPLQSPTKLFHNNGDGTFTDIAIPAGIPGAETGLSAAMADINNDGLLDLFITSPGHLGVAFPPGLQHNDRLYLNNGDLTFTDITESAGVTGGRGSCVSSFSDYNRDGWVDLFVGACNDVTFAPAPFHLYRNNKDNTFTDVTVEAGLGDGYWMSAAMGDINNDGHIDLFATNFGPFAPNGAAAPHALYQNNGDGTFTDVASPELALNDFGWGATFADFDNDGFLDLFFTGSLPAFDLIGPGLGNPGRMFFNNRQGGFVQDNEAHGLDLSSEYVTGVARGDFDNNGFPDIVISSSAYQITDSETGIQTEAGSGNPVLLKNNGNNNHWLTIRLKGVKSNSMGIGARISLHTWGGNRQVREVYAGSSFAASETPWPTFGLGKRYFAFALVDWPSGLSEWFPFIYHGDIRTLVEGSGIRKKHRY